MRAIALIIAVIVIVAIFAERSADPPLFRQRGFYVIDGDSLAIGDRRIRLTGFDTPETWKYGCQAELLAGRMAALRMRMLVTAPAGGKIGAGFYRIDIWAHCAHYQTQTMTQKKPRQKNYPIMQPAELIAARKEMGLTLAEAARKYEISLRGYKQYEYGERSIPGPVRLLTQYYLKDHRKNNCTSS